MIKIDHVSKSYDGGATKAVRDLSLEIRSGEIFGLLGPNGAGKSTLLNMLAGVLAPSSGTIELDGVNVATDPLAAKRNLCYVSDSPDHLLRLKGHEFLRFIADVYEVPDAVRGPRIEELAREYGMEGELDNQIQSYSHGMRQKMMIMGALLPDPAIWILDEPMVGLDPRTMRAVSDYMRAYAEKGGAVLFSTHNLDAVKRICDRAVVIRNGLIELDSPVAELDGDDLLERFFPKGEED